jgi:O-palmitoleoyl-L-serine hydrolase
MLPTTAPGKCLDGTPGGFWISPGSEHTKYLIHLEGGGWCISYEDCLARSQTNLGSSLKWPVNVTTNQDGGDHGLLNREMALNPVTHNWTLVYVG